MSRPVYALMPRKLKFIIKFMFIIFIITPISILCFRQLIIGKCDDIFYDTIITLKNNTFNKVVSQVMPDSDWSPIINSQISIYSAFLSTGSKVRIISIVDQDAFRHQSNIECIFVNIKNTTRKHTSKAYLTVLTGNYFGYIRFAASEIDCTLPYNYRKNQIYVKIRFTVNSNTDESEYLKLEKQLNEQNLDTVVCVRPLYGPYKSLSAIIEFLAYYKANDIKRFAFYDLDIDEKVRNFLKIIPNVIIIPFNLKIDPKLIHAYGQMASMNDCLLRYSTSPIIFVDIDEYIMIQTINKTTIQSLIEEKIKIPTISSLIINNRFFCTQFQSDNRFPRILHHNKMQTYFWRPDDRSKMIILRPNTVYDIWIHSVYGTKSGYTSQKLSDSEVLLYHYRSCCNINQAFLHLEHLDLYFSPNTDSYSDDNQMYQKFSQNIMYFINEYVEKFEEISGSES